METQVEIVKVKIDTYGNASDPIMGDSTLLDTGDILITKEEYQALKKKYKVD